MFARIVARYYSNRGVLL